VATTENCNKKNIRKTIIRKPIWNSNRSQKKRIIRKTIIRQSFRNSPSFGGQNKYSENNYSGDIGRSLWESQYTLQYSSSYPRCTRRPHFFRTIMKALHICPTRLSRSIWSPGSLGMLAFLLASRLGRLLSGPYFFGKVPSSSRF